MKVVYTEEALEDLDAIADWLIAHYPTVAPAVERRIQSVVAHIARWPESSRRSAKRPGVRAVPLGPISIQDFLSRHRRYGGDTPYPSRRAAAMGCANLYQHVGRHSEAFPPQRLPPPHSYALPHP